MLGAYTGGGRVSERLLTAREVGELLGLSTESVLRRWRRGDMPAFRLATNVLRFRESEVDTWLEGLHERAGAGGEAPATPLRPPRSTLGLASNPVVQGGEDDAS